ncbi:ATP-binding protein [Pseudorhizobium marinum]|uniref:ATP-binding protein n=1 Tax=Pseudorhizobium marinum TaxID=1496690 RepID=UPI0006902CA7|nr:ATP-binding protein [Pseudorhizobium marinum]
MSELSDTDAIRKASRATAVLQTFAVVLLLGLAVVFALISNRYSSLQDGIRENALWSIYQLDRETRKLHETMHDLTTRRDYAPDSLRPALLRYDILYSRMAILNNGDFDRKFGGDRDAAPLLSSIQSSITAIEPVFNEIAAAGSTSEASFQAAKVHVIRLMANTEDLLLYANSAVSLDRAENRSQLLSLQVKSGLLVILLVVCVGVLVHLLRRQLQSVRAAGSKLKAMTGDLEVAYRAVESANQAKSQFLATMSHEVRTPLNAILGTAELLDLSDIPAAAHHSVGTIRRSGEALLEIINEILDYGKIENGMLEIEARPTAIRSVACSALGIVQDRARENRNLLQFEIDEDAVFPVILCDPTRLRQVLLNLLSNACKFTSDGVITLRISQFQTDGGDRMRFEISDTGIGIDEDGIGKLFQPFSQVDASINRRFGGTGLGLTICRQIVERLSGKIGVSSIPGKGSIFWFEIPATAVEPEVGASDVATTGPRELPQLKVLLVEDNKVNQDVAKGFLLRLGQHVTVAGDGLEAVREVSEGDFDLVLMDMQMPVVDGLEATRMIRALPGLARLRIIAMTANASDDDRRLCADAGMDGFQSKPITMATLRKIVLETDTVAPRPRTVVQEETGFEARRLELVEALGDDGFRELLSDFFEDAEKLLAQIKTAANEGDVKRTARLLHSLRGASANLGFTGVVSSCMALEASGLAATELDGLAATFHEQRRRIAA